MPAAVEVQGLQSFKESLDRLEKGAARRVVRKALKTATNMMAEATKSAAPVDTGLLKSSIVVQGLKVRRGQIGFKVGFTNVDAIVAKSNSNPNNPKRYFYPAVVEYGGKGHSPHPFMRSAFETHKDAAKDIIIQELKDGIIKEAKKQTVGAALGRFSKSIGFSRVRKKLGKFQKKAKRLLKRTTKRSTKLLKKTKKKTAKLIKKANKATKRSLKNWRK